jgi:ABC-type Fe3+-hydroxamate transport system substrate-binding protein
MAAGKKTFINDILIRCGFENAIQSEDSRYPALSINDLQTYNPEVVFLSSEPYPFKKHHLEYFKKHLPNANVILVDGEMFSWYGSRLLKACNYFKIIQENLAKS